ncbi:MAG: sodium/proton-translocating pyrophosphatase [bacterium]|nr:sodium/proton-translocating pyrophosphatase [bacterium]
MIILPVALSLIILVFCVIQYFSITKTTLENSEVNELAEFVSEGIFTYSKRVLSSILQIVFYVTVVLLLFSFLFHKHFSWLQIAAFFIGCTVMASGAYISLSIAPRFVRHIIGSSQSSFSEGLQLLFTASTTIGFVVISFVILGLAASYYFLGIDSITGFGLGVGLASFFLRIGGGLYKAGADVGADIVSKVEEKVPDFDSRNPASIMDITGDFIGDITGFSADILGSFAFAIISCFLFSYSLMYSGYISKLMAFKLLQLPVYLVALSLVIKFVSFFYVRLRIKMKYVDNILLEGIYIAVILCAVSAFFVIKNMDIYIGSINFLGGERGVYPFPAYLAGLLGAVFIGFVAEYITSATFFPAKKIAEEAEYGPVITLFNGMALGLKSNGFFLLCISVITVISFYFAGFYGIAMAAMGMLSVTGQILAANIFGQLSADVFKISKLAKSDERIIKNTSKMESIGNTASAIGNGFATGVTVLSTFSLFFSLVIISGQDLSYLLMIDLKLVAGIIIGVSTPFVFSGFLLRGLSKIILTTIHEVGRQFREIPYLYEKKGRPDVIKATDHNSCIAMNVLIIPGIIMVFSPILIGYFFGSKMLLGFAFGAFLAGFNQGFYWSNLGDSLHNAKHYIENGHFGGRDSVTFQHILIADNVGDAYKDLLSPSINILIKSITIISILVILLLNR